MKYQQITAILRKIPFFDGLDEHTLGYIAQFGKGVSLKEGDVLFQEDDLGDRMFLIISGQVEVYRIIDGGYIVTLATLKASDILGEMSLLDAFPRSASAKAVTDCALISLSRGEFQLFLESHCSVAIKLLSTLSRKLRDANEKLTERKRRGYYPDV